MNKGQKDILSTAIASYRKHDASVALAAAYPDQTDLSALLIGPMSAENFATFSDRVINNFEEIIKSGLWSVFPHLIQNNTIHIPGIPEHTTRFVQYIQDNNCPAAHQHLEQLIKAQLELGVWALVDKTKTPSRAEVMNIAARLDVQVKRIEATKKSLTDLLESGAQERKTLNEFTAEKKNEFAEIRKLLETAKQQHDQLAELLNQGNKTDVSIKVIHDRNKKLIEELGIELGVIKKEFEGIQVSSNELLEEQTKNTSDAHTLMAQTSNLYQFIKSKEQEIIKLLGMAADASLGTKYNARGEQIGKGLRFWQWAVPVSVVVAVIWVIVVFTWLKTDDFNPWVNLGINLLKTSPVFVIMGFVFSQYTKERNLQEEWMFKAAVAMTINTYADLLEDKDKDTNQSRQQLILNALKQVHSPPQLYSNKGGSLFSLKAKELRAVLESLNETIQNIKPQG